MKRLMTIANRIKQRRLMLTLSQERLAESIGVKQSAVSGWEVGRNRPKGDVLIRLADRLGVSEEWLQFGDNRSRRKQTRIRGLLGAGDQVLMLPDDAVEWTNAPPDEEIETEAFEVRGNSQWPVYRNGDIIFYEKDRTGRPSDLIGEEAIVELDDGGLYLKRIMRGSRSGLYTLASHNAPEMEDRRIISCAEIIWIRRKRRNLIS